MSFYRAGLVACAAFFATAMASVAFAGCGGCGGGFAVQTYAQPMVYAPPVGYAPPAFEYAPQAYAPPPVALPPPPLPNPLAATGFDLGPDDMARSLSTFADAGLINIAGGCCGNTPEHIAAIAQALECKPPRALNRIEVAA